jgi:hypothetical protein
MTGGAALQRRINDRLKKSASAAEGLEDDPWLKPLFFEQLIFAGLKALLHPRKFLLFTIEAANLILRYRALQGALQDVAKFSLLCC